MSSTFMDALELMHSVAFAAAAPRTDREIAFGMDEALRPGRREDDRKRQLLPEQLNARIELRNVYQDARLEANVLIRFVIPAHGELIGGRAHDAFPRAMGNMFFRLGLKIEQREEFVEIGLL